MQSEPPDPVNLDAATAVVTAEHMAEAFGCGPDLERHPAMARTFADVGYDHLALINAGPDVDGSFEHAAHGLIEKARALGREGRPVLSPREDRTPGRTAPQTGRSARNGVCLVSALRDRRRSCDPFDGPSHATSDGTGVGAMTRMPRTPPRPVA